ncbi:MAG: S46 family peptidase [Flavobacteriia bacterium]|nr:S46 family peptidase [Flavobacteriia bacterium]
MKNLITCVFFLTFSFLKAEEGMLIPSLLSAFESDMQAKGMKLTAEQIYSVNHSSLKDAIIHFGGGCTAELVSNKGLLLTNHHCGYSQIQSHSSLEKDYLKNGFWAKDLSSELPNNNLTATRIVRIEEVTKEVFFSIVENEETTSKLKKIKSNIAKLVADAQIGNHFEAEIKAFDYGNHYYLLVKEVFLDVRFVGTPPNSIGKFGGDTDNWVWPRHTGDFSVFRIYCGKDNKPAPYSLENVPYTPIHFLPISFKDRKKGDFTMVYGFPGQTEQHLVSGHLKYILEKERPARIKMRELSLSVIDKAMKESDQTRIQYAAKQASIANAYKKWIGQIGGLREMNSIQKKLSYESNYNQNALSNQNFAKFQHIISQMNAMMSEYSKYDFEYQMYIEYVFVGAEVFDLCRAIDEIIKNYSANMTKEELDAFKNKYISSAESFYKDYNIDVDKQIFLLQSKEYFKNIESELSTSFLYSPNEKSNELYLKSILTNKDKYIQWINNLSNKSINKIKNDKAYSHYLSVSNRIKEQIVPKYRELQAQMNSYLKIYVEGKYLLFPDDKHWSDANGTLRVTYGQLEGSAPYDGMTYTEHTTLDGIIQKYYTGNSDFEIENRMLDLYKKKEYGSYAQDEELWVCFTGSNHTTGGNSGSPVLDENGYLMGLNFDRTWESTMSDYHFDSKRCRNVVVDIRYVLWVMDIYSGAKHLVDEMVLMK